MRKFSLLMPVFVISLIWFCTGCSSEPTASTDSKSVSTTKPADVEPIVYNGQYKDDIFEGEVAADVIDIYIVNEGTKSLYWQGTFKPSPSDKTFESVADREALDASLMGSLDEKKVFKLNDGRIIFDFTMMGITKTVKLAKI